MQNVRYRQLEVLPPITLDLTKYKQFYVADQHIKQTIELDLAAKVTFEKVSNNRIVVSTNYTYTKESLLQLANLCISAANFMKEEKIEF